MLSTWTNGVCNLLTKCKKRAIRWIMDWVSVYAHACALCARVCLHVYVLACAFVYVSRGAGWVGSGVSQFFFPYTVQYDTSAWNNLGMGSAYSKILLCLETIWSPVQYKQHSTVQYSTAKVVITTITIKLQYNTKSFNSKNYEYLITNIYLSYSKPFITQLKHLLRNTYSNLVSSSNQVIYHSQCDTTKYSMIDLSNIYI